MRPSLSVAINPHPSVSPHPVLTSATTGEPAGFDVVIGGGTGPFTYPWRFGDGAIGAGSALVHDLAKGGTCSIKVWASDSAGESAHISITCNVTPPAAAPPAMAPFLFWGGAGAPTAGSAVGTHQLRRLLPRARRSG